MRVNAVWFGSSAFLIVVLLLTASLAAGQQTQTAAAGKTRIVLLGTGTPGPDPDRSGPATAIVVNDVAYLVDLGPGVVRRASATFLDKGIKALEPTKLRVAFVTHLHSDHTKEALRELKGVTVTVRVAPKAERVGLLESQIRADIEQQLRAAHVPLLGHPRDIVFAGGRRVNNFPPLLSVLVDVTPQGAKALAYAIEVVVSQDASDPQDPRAKTSVTTWCITKAGTYNKRRLKQVTREIEIAVDQFISDYVAVNTLASLFLASPAMAQRSRAPRMVLVESGSSIQDAIDAVKDEGTVGEIQRPPRQLPPPTDIDPKLTEEFRQLEQQLCDAILHKDAKILDRLVGPEYTLRVADIPQSSLPRAIWMDNTLKRLKPESCEQHHYAARKLADDLAVVSLLWTQKGTIDGRDFSGDFYVVDFCKKRRGDWQIIARYSSPVGKPPERPLRQLPAPTDSDLQLTDLLRQLEQELGEAALHGFKDTKAMERLVSPEFTQRVSDAPERSLPRGLWGQPSGTYKIESIEGRHHAARKLTDDLAVVSLLLTQQATSEGRDRSGDFYVVDIWKRSGDRWRMIARYSSPMGKKFDRSLPR